MLIDCLVVRHGEWPWKIKEKGEWWQDHSLSSSDWFTSTSYHGVYLSQGLIHHTLFVQQHVYFPLTWRYPRKRELCFFCETNALMAFGAFLNYAFIGKITRLTIGNPGKKQCGLKTLYLYGIDSEVKWQISFLIKLN